jgi:hypothetical protein
VKSINGLRKQQSKKPNQDHIALIENLSDEVFLIHSLLLGIAEEMRADTPKGADVQTLYNRYLQIEARDSLRAA